MKINLNGVIAEASKEILEADEILNSLDIIPVVTPERRIKKLETQFTALTKGYEEGVNQT